MAESFGAESMANCKAPGALGEVMNPTMQRHIQQERLSQKVRATMEMVAVDGLSAHYSSLADDSSVAPKTREAGVMFSAAEEQLYEEEADEALQNATTAMELFREAGDKNGETDALRLIINASRVKEAYDEASEKANAELTTFRESEDKRGTASMLLSIGEIQMARDEETAALTSLAEALELFKEVGDKKMQANVMLCMCSVYLTREEGGEAQMNASDALALFQALGDKKGEGRAFLATGAAQLVDLDKIDEGFESAKSGLECFKAISDRKMEIAALDLMAYSMILKEKPQPACELSAQANSIAREIGYGRGEAMAVNTLVHSCLLRGDAKKALTYAEQVLSRFKNSGDKKGEAAACDMLMYVWAAKHEPDQALLVAEEELEILKELGYKRKLAILTLVSALLHVNKESGVDAMSNVDEAVSIFTEIKDKKGEAIATYVKVFAHIVKEEYTEAIEAAEEARLIFQELGDKRFEAETLVAKGIASVVKGSYDEGISSVTDAQEIFQELGDRKGTAATWLKMADLHVARTTMLRLKETPSKAEISQVCQTAVDATDGALEILRDLGHKKGQAAALHLQAAAQIANDEPEAALQLEMDARALCRKADDWKSEAILVQLITEAHLTRYVKEMDSLSQRGVERKKVERLMRDTRRKAFKAAKDALGVAKRSDNKDLIGQALVNMARAQLVNGKFEQALKARDEAISLFKEIGEKREEAIAITLGAEIYFEKQDHEKALEVGNQGLQAAQKITDARAEIYAIGILNSIYSMVDTTGPAQQMYMPMDMGGAGGMEASAGGGELAPYSGPTADQLRPRVQELALSLLGNDEVAADSPLMDSGLDSLSMVQFRNTLQQQFNGVPMPASLIFDHPSITAVADYIAGELKDNYYKGQ